MNKDYFSKRSVSLLLTLPLVLVGCAEPANQQAMIPGQIGIIGPSSPYKQNIRQVSGYGGEETNPALASKISKASFQAALETSIRKAGLYSDQGQYSLRADILSLDQPLIGIDMRVSMTVRYNLIDDQGNVRFDETITSVYVAEFSEAFYGVERLQRANEGAARENINIFLRKMGVSGQAGVIGSIS
jgi:hypothetical protein